MRSKLAALAALAMLSASTGAVAQSAASMPSPSVRAGEQTQGSNELVGTTAWILAGIALGLIIWGIIELTDDSDSP